MLTLVQHSRLYIALILFRDPYSGARGALFPGMSPQDEEALWRQYPPTTSTPY